MTTTGILSMAFCREDVDNIEYLLLFMIRYHRASAADLDNICFTFMTSFPLHFSGLARTSIPPPASPVRSNPPREKAIAPPLPPRTDRALRGRSNSLARNADDHLSCPETRSCPPPSSGGRKRVRIFVGTTDGKDGLLGNVDSQRRDAAHLNAQTNAACESFLKTLKYEEVYRSEYRDLQDARASIGQFLEKVYNQKRLHSALGYLPPVEFEAQWAAQKNQEAAARHLSL